MFQSLGLIFIGVCVSGGVGGLLLVAEFGYGARTDDSAAFYLLFFAFAMVLWGFVMVVNGMLGVVSCLRGSKQAIL